MGVARIYSRIHCLLGRVLLGALTWANVVDLQLMSDQNQSRAGVILVQPNLPILKRQIQGYVKRMMSSDRVFNNFKIKSISFNEEMVLEVHLCSLPTTQWEW
jgi:hypothetical protein